MSERVERTARRGLRRMTGHQALVGVVAAVAITVVACGQSSQTPTPAPPSPTPVHGGTLVIATASTSGVLNPATTSNGGIHPISEPMFNGLYAFSPSNTVVPDLAASMPKTTDNSDGTEDVVIALRSGMQWQNGTPITNDDVVFSFTESLLRYQSRTAASMAPALGVTGVGNKATVPATAITEPDGPAGHQVKFHFLFHYAPFIDQLNVTEAPIIPKNVYAHCAVDGGDGTLGNQTAPFCPENLKPIGSGPFKFQSVSPTQLVLARNPTYFKSNLPYLDSVVFQVTTTPQTGLEAARSQSGSIDVATPPATTLSSFTNNSAYDVVQVARGSGGGNCITTLAFNLWKKGETPAQINAKPASTPYDHPILSDQAVRKAIFEGFDRQAAFTNIEFRVGKLATSPINSNLTAAYASQNLPAFNPTQARTDLQNAGWIDPSKGADPTTTRVSDGRSGLPAAGTPLQIDVIHFDTGTQVQYGQQMVANLKQIGIAVTDRPESNGQTQTDMGARNYDTTFVSYCDGDDPVIGVRRQYVSSQISTTAFTNQSGIRSAQMDGLWDQAIRSTGTQYTSLYHQIQTLAASTLPYVWITETVSARVSRSVCHNFNNQNTGLFMETAWCTG